MTSGKHKCLPSTSNSKRRNAAAAVGLSADRLAESVSRVRPDGIRTAEPGVPGAASTRSQWVLLFLPLLCRVEFLRAHRLAMVTTLNTNEDLGLLGASQSPSGVRSYYRYSRRGTISTLNELPSGLGKRHCQRAGRGELWFPRSLADLPNA